MTPSSYPDELLSAYLDGELTEEQRAEVDQRLAADPTAQQLLSELQSLKGTLGRLPEEKADHKLRERILAQIAERENTLAPRGDDRRPMHLPVNRRGLAWAGAAIAATALLAIYQPDNNVEDQPALAAVDSDAAETDDSLRASSAERSGDRREDAADFVQRGSPDASHAEHPRSELAAATRAREQPAALRSATPRRAGSALSAEADVEEERRPAAARFKSPRNEALEQSVAGEGHTSAPQAGARAVELSGERFETHDADEILAGNLPRRDAHPGSGRSNAKRSLTTVEITLAEDGGTSEDFLQLLRAHDVALLRQPEADKLDADDRPVDVGQPADYEQALLVAAAPQQVARILDACRQDSKKFARVKFDIYQAAPGERPPPQIGRSSRRNTTRGLGEAASADEFAPHMKMRLEDSIPASEPAAESGRLLEKAEPTQPHGWALVLDPESVSHLQQVGQSQELVDARQAEKVGPDDVPRVEILFLLRQAPGR